MLCASPFLCEECKIVPKISKSMIQNVPVTTIFEYEGNFRRVLLQYKEHGDRFLAPVFLHSVLLDLKLMGSEAIYICAPSRDESIKKRGFEHLELLLEVYGFKTLNCFYNNSNEDQTQSKNRQDIVSKIGLKSTIPKQYKNLILFDDVITSGSTIRACYDLLKSSGNKVKVIVLAKTTK